MRIVSYNRPYLKTPNKGMRKISESISFWLYFHHYTFLIDVSPPRATSLLSEITWKLKFVFDTENFPLTFRTKQTRKVRAPNDNCMKYSMRVVCFKLIKCISLIISLYAHLKNLDSSHVFILILNISSN